MVHILIYLASLLATLSNLCHFQRTAFMEDWSMLVGSGCALVAIAAESTALYDSRISLVVLHEIFETVGFSGISLMRFTILSRLMVL